MNVVFMALGTWLAIFWSFRHIRWLLIGVALIIVGWFSIAFAGPVLRFAENAAAFCVLLASQHRATAAPKMSMLSRLLYRN